jgi:hypothetical protein
MTENQPAAQGLNASNRCQAHLNRVISVVSREITGEVIDETASCH